MQTIINEIEIYQSPIKLKEPFIISLGPVYYAENSIIVIKTNNGIVGFGECSPFMSINGENMLTGYVVAQYLAKVLIGKNALDIEMCTIEMDKVIYGNASIKSAFDMALYDIAAQNAKLPLYKFLGGANNKEIITDYTISFGDKHKMVSDALKIVANGFQIIKIKLGESKEKDVERIRLIREAVGMQIPMRIDANQGWTADTTLDILHELKQYNIQHCEEPIPRWDFMSLPKIKKLSPIPIMCDESLCDHNDAKRLLDIDACHLFNVKLGKSGGIFKALKIIALAEKANVKIQLGGFLESRLSFTAAVHLALSSDAIIHCDFDTPLMLEEDPVVGGMKYEKGGRISIGNEVGIGATIDEGFLRKLEKIIIK